MLRSITSRGVLAAVFLLAALAASPSFAQRPLTVATAVDCRELEPMIDPGAIPAHFLPDTGQRNDGSDFHLPAIGGGLAVGPGGIAYDAGEHAVVQQFLDTAPSFVASVGATTGASTTVLAGDTAWTLPNIAAIETDGFFPGISLALTSTHRVLTLRLTAESGSDPSAVRWVYTEAAKIYVAPGSGGHLRVRRADGSHLDVRRPRAWQVAADGTEDPIDAAFTVDVGGTVGLTVGVVDPASGWHVEIETLFGAAGAHYRTARHGEEVVVTAQATAARGGTGGDILTFGLARDGAVRWGALLAGDGEDQAHAVVIDEDGSILVAGATTSSDFPALAGPGAGGLDGFVVRLAPRGLETLAGTRLHAAEGNDVAGAVLIDEDGSILVGGQTQVAPERRGGLSFAALVPTRTVERHPTYLSRLNAELSETVETVSYEAPSLQRYEMWRTCEGKIALGPAAVADSSCGSWPSLTYEMAYKAEDYHLDHDWGSTVPGLGSPPGGWGYHALRWRFYNANDIAAPPAWTIDWSLAPSGTPIPKGTNPVCGDHHTLNTLETLLYAQGSSTANPPNGWGCSSHGSVQELALAAAFYSQRYDSPTYTHFGEWSNLGMPWTWGTYPVGIEETEWDVICPFGSSSYNGQGLEDLCDFTSGWMGGINCTASANGVMGGTVSQPFYLQAKTFEVAQWRGFTGFLRGVHYNTDFAWWYDDFYEAGDYIVDPPDDPNESLLVAEAIAQLSNFTTNTQPVRLDVYEHGELTASSEGTVAIRSTPSP